MSAHYTHVPVTQQPKPATMVPTNHLPFNFNSESAPRCDSCTQEQHKCSRFLFRRLIFPAAIAVCLLLAGLTACSLAQGHLSWSDLELEGLFPRAISGTDNSSNSSPFVKNKLYLIVLFVGILVVIGLGISLAFWCCRGSFRNPLCCPCYLCACCGGLACLECIGCGLCAEAVEV